MKIVNQAETTALEATTGQKPETLVKYGKVIVISENDEDPETLKRRLGEKPASEKSTEDILNTILPPCEFRNEYGERCCQFVLTTPASAFDVVELQAALDDQLQRQRARETGICFIRERLYAQCFDELIRQVTINCCHRGIILVKIRDELKTTLGAYQKLYSSCIAFGLRSAVDGLVKKDSMQEEIDSLEKSIANLEEENKSLEDEINKLLESDESTIEQEKKDHAAMLIEMSEENVDLRNKLKAILSI